MKKRSGPKCSLTCISSCSKANQKLSSRLCLNVSATTGLGLLMSTVTESQVAAMVGTSIGTLLPAIQFSGMLDPVSSLEGAGAWVGMAYPTTHFLTISRGTFSKALGLSDLYTSFIPLLIVVPVLVALGTVLLKKQEH